MIDDQFKKTMQSNAGCAVILAGSDSDRAHIERITKSLTAFSIPHQVRICSSHKQPADLMKIIEEYNAVGGSITYVAVAGGTDALSGTLSYHALGPVVSCPPDAPNESCLTNPPGSSNAYIARPENVGKFIAQMYAGANPTFKELLKQAKSKKIDALKEADSRFREDDRSG